MLALTLPWRAARRASSSLCRDCHQASVLLALRSEDGSLASTLSPSASYCTCVIIAKLATEL